MDPPDAQEPSGRRLGVRFVLQWSTQDRDSKIRQVGDELLRPLTKEVPLGLSFPSSVRTRKGGFRMDVGDGLQS